MRQWVGIFWLGFAVRLAVGEPPLSIEEPMAKANALLAKSQMLLNSDVATTQAGSQPATRPVSAALGPTLQRIRDMHIFEGTFTLTVVPETIRPGANGGLEIEARLAARPRPLSFYYYDVERVYMRNLDGWVKQRINQIQRDKKIIAADAEALSLEVYRQRDEQAQKLDEFVARRKQYYEALHATILVEREQADAVRAAAKIDKPWHLTARVDDFNVIAPFVDHRSASAPSGSQPASSGASQPVEATTQAATMLQQGEVMGLVNTLPATIGSLRLTFVGP